MIELEDVRAARERVAETARHTPLDYSHTFSEMAGAEVHLKHELFQRTGSFKIRGGTNRITTLSDAEQAAGVVTASAGNHAQGVALAATRAGVDSTIVMPETAPVSKIHATRDYGGNVELYGHDYDDATERAHEIEAEEGRTYVPAFNDWAIMAGQGTIGLEIYEDLPSVDTVVVPIGGGGIISGIATALKGIDSDIRIIGVQVEGAETVADALAKGEVITLDSVSTIADGIATGSVGEKTLSVIDERVDEVVTVTDSEIAVAVTKLLERAKVLAEGAGAAPVAALLNGYFEYDADETIVPVLSGGNIDLNTLSNVILRGLAETGRYLKFRTVVADQPGRLEQLLEILADHRANIYAVSHDRTSRTVSLNDTGIELDIETRGPDHVEAILESLDEAGYAVEVLV
jgi:threonine dehydratase